ncbi:Methyltransferase-like protein 9 [Hondaea fermentalgiana]|uniref:Methyltransferase-like protein 9 n=1 Tax=Hondaea fermentalgiana TaxID=2315210 RepID=A0A2R5GRT1_9STRA|nr:Methyltransferase-like protein 9 [Hondaea fermentalgiana]|eukprot:GBG31051.1 Methyltransferase-like protein 9 [Hondaea fermentalgiana]
MVGTGHDDREQTPKTMAAPRTAAAKLRYGAGQALQEAARSRGVRFCELHADDATRRFVDTAPVAPPSQALAHRVLSLFMSYYDANAALGIYPLHLFSQPQWTQLMREADLLPTGSAENVSKRFSRVLDIGAGDGSMAQELLLPLADEVHATETASRMAALARKRGIDCKEIDVSAPDAGRELGSDFDLVCIFNVLDRTARPLSLLRTASELLAPGGACVIASPLPMRQICFDGSLKRQPDETLPMPDPRSPELAAYSSATDNDNWDAYAYAFMFDFLPQHAPGLRLDTFTRLPYLSGGDLAEPLIEYDDIAVVLRKDP